MSGLTQQQRERRLNRIGGSSIAGVLGFSPYGPPSHWAHLIRGELHVDETDEMFAGNALEDGIRQIAQRELARRNPFDDYAAGEKPDTVLHADYGSWWAVHPDYLFTGIERGLQIKNHSPWIERDWPKQDPQAESDNGAAPIEHHLQCLWEMEAVRSQLGAGYAQEWWLGCFFGGARVRLYRITPRPRLLGDMIRKAYRFWRLHIDPAGPRTDPDDSDWHAAPKDWRAPEKPVLSAEELAELRKQVPFSAEVAVSLRSSDYSRVTTPF